MMKKINISLCVVLTLMCCYLLECRQQRYQLTENLVRLHVVANSDSKEDQRTKLLVRDAVISYLNPLLAGVQDIENAKEILSGELASIRAVAYSVLRTRGSRDDVRVSLCKEEFDTRHYDTFSLPAGVYSSLRISIGEGEGHNWWCVVFPSLCLPATGDGFRDVATGAGFSDAVSGSLTGKKPYKIRFYIMDALGKLENLLN